MEHSFDIDIAKDYGIPAAILLKHIYYWVEKNRVNEKHCFDGEYWTYCSVKAFGELFPYMGAKVIRNGLQKLEDGGLIKVGCFNDQLYDRTKWYTLTSNGRTLCRNGKRPFAETTETLCPKGEPIPDIINTDILLSNDNNITNTQISEIVAIWNSELSPLGVSKIVGLASASSRYKHLKARLKEYGNGSFRDVINKVKESDFLLGKIEGKDGRKPFKLTFSWIVDATHYVDVLEGKYDNRGTSKPTHVYEMPTGLEKPQTVRQG